jgi:hypothetical protein
MQASAYPSSTTRYGISREPAEALRTVLRGSVGQYVQHSASEHPRIPLPSTPVNRGERKGRGCSKPRLSHI